MRCSVLRLCLALVIGLVSQSCWAQSNMKYVRLANPEITAARIAERWMVEHNPKFDTIEHLPSIIDKGDRWVVDYDLGPDTYGGDYMIEIEKASFKVLQVMRGQ
jgi:NTF2 fold immunity protein